MPPRQRPVHQEIYHPTFDPGVTGCRTGVLPPKDARRGVDGFERFSDYDPSPNKLSPPKKISPLKQNKRIRTQRPDKFHEIGERGRKTGVSPPANAPRGSNGFEDFGAYLVKATEMTNKHIERERQKNAIISRNARKMSVATFVDDGEDESELYREEDSMSIVNSDVDSTAVGPNTHHHSQSTQQRMNGKNPVPRRTDREGTTDSASSPIRTAHDSELVDFDRAPETPLPRSANGHQPVETRSSPSSDGAQLSDGSDRADKGKQKASDQGYQSDASDGEGDGIGFDYDQGPQNDDADDQVNQNYDGPEPLDDIPEEDEDGNAGVKTSTGDQRDVATAQPKRRKINSRPPPANGVRRSQRQRLPRLAHWRGEHVVYGRSETPEGNLCVVGMVDVVRVPDDSGPPFAQLRARRGASRRIKSESVPPGGFNDPDKPNPDDGADELDSKTTSSGVVFSHTKQTEVWRRVVSTKRDQNNVRQKSEGNDQFQFQRIFTESDYAAAGILYIPVGKAKPTKASKDNSYDFIVLRGHVSVKIHRTNFVVGPEGMVHVPRGNLYSLENVGNCVAKIAFSQSRRISAGSDPDEESDGNEQPLDQPPDDDDDDGDAAVAQIAAQADEDQDEEAGGQQTS